MDVNNSSAVRRMRRPQIRPAWARRYELTLVGRRTVAQNVLRVTLSGFDLEEFRYQGGDHRCTLLIPWPAEEARRFMWPTASDPWTGAAQWGFIAALTRPLRRPLTVSGYRPEQLEIDFDILLHGDSPLTTWARGVRPGTAVRVIDNGRRYRVPDGTRTQILIADEAGAPAALAVAAETPPSVPTALYIPGTVAAAEGRHPGGHVSVVTVPARSGDRTPEKRFAEAVLADAAGVLTPVGSEPLVDGGRLSTVPDLVGIAGERSFTRQLVCSLRKAGVPRGAIHAGNYWRLR